MANPGTLVRGMAQLLGMSEVYMAAYDRELAKHGLRSKRGRGTSAAVMTASDATNLLIAVMSGAQAKDAAEAVVCYAGLLARVQKTSVSDGSKVMTFFNYRGHIDSGSLGLSSIDALAVGHSFFDFINAMIESAECGELERAVGDRVADKKHQLPGSRGTWGLSIRVSAPEPQAETSLGCDGAAYGCIYSRPKTDSARGDLQREMRISESTIIGIGRILRE